MTNLKTRLAAGLTTVAILATSFAPAAFAATDITVSGNGADSINKVKVKAKHKVTVKQKNSTAVTNAVTIGQNTGGNKANKNTGGGVAVNSGDATASVMNTTTAGGNTAMVDSCGCVAVAPTVSIDGNGADSTNKVTLSSKYVTTATQKNTTSVVNGVVVGQDTGSNTANSNTGGTVDVTSGDAGVTVVNTTTVGLNSLTLN